MAMSVAVKLRRRGNRGRVNGNESYTTKTRLAAQVRRACSKTFFGRPVQEVTETASTLWASLLPGQGGSIDTTR
jgi:hypothetical protein